MHETNIWQGGGGAPNIHISKSIATTLEKNTFSTAPKSYAPYIFNLFILQLIFYFSTHFLIE